MIKADSLKHNATFIEDKWYVARPIKPRIKERIKDAIQVVIGKADAVVFYKQ